MKFIPKLSNREKFLLYISLTAITLLLVDKFIFSRMLSEIKKIESETSVKYQELEENIQILSRQERINRESELYGNYLVKEESPDTKFREMVNILAIGAELIVREIKFLTPKEKDITKYTIDLVAEGKMRCLVNFLYNFNNVTSLIKVEKMDLTPTAPKSESLGIHLVISKTIIH
jgi:hypothetical protein